MCSLLSCIECLFHTKLYLTAPYCLQGFDVLHVQYNSLCCKHENRLNKECFAFSWPGKQFCHVLSTLISALGWLWRLYSMWQRRAGDCFCWHPGTTPHWSSPLKCHINSNKALPYQGPWRPELLGCRGAEARINTKLNEERRWWRRWGSSAGVTSCPQAPGWVRCHRYSRGLSSRDCILITRYTLSSCWVTALMWASLLTDSCYGHWPVCSLLPYS